MANLYVATDQGGAVIEEGDVYTKVGLVAGSPNINPVDIDETDFNEYTFNVADNRGKTYYPAGQWAVAWGVYGATFANPDPEGWYTYINPIPADGVLRVWGENLNHHPGRLVLRINGTSYDPGADDLSQVDAEPYDVAQGDNVEIHQEGSSSTWDVRVAYLPFTWPISSSSSSSSSST